MPPSKIGVVLRDVHGVGPHVVRLTGNKILRVLKCHGSFTDLRFVNLLLVFCRSRVFDRVVLGHDRTHFYVLPGFVGGFELWCSVDLGFLV